MGLCVGRVFFLWAGALRCWGWGVGSPQMSADLRDLDKHKGRARARKPADACTPPQRLVSYHAQALAQREAVLCGRQKGSACGSGSVYGQRRVPVLRRSVEGRAAILSVETRVGTAVLEHCSASERHCACDRLRPRAGCCKGPVRRAPLALGDAACSAADGRCCARERSALLGTPRASQYRKVCFL